MVSDPLKIAGRLLGLCSGEDFAGYDPFDSLNSVLFRSTPLSRSALARLAWLQFGKRSPVNFRPLLRVPRSRNPKGVGLFILGLCEDHVRTGSREPLHVASGLAEWLLGQRCDPGHWHHSCWGYNFDWQARAFFVPRGTPNVITTVYIARALHRLGTLLQRSDLVEVAFDAAKFIRRSLLVEADDGSYIGYIPGENVFVHNASLWGAAWCAFAGHESGDSSLFETGTRVAMRSVRGQGSDGSWRYGSLSHHGFIDGFHTGYNLEALSIISGVFSSNEIEASVSRGLEFYKSRLIGPDGSAGYYLDQRFPLDTHSYAQAIITLCVLCGPEDSSLLGKVVENMVSEMYDQKSGYFLYQKHRYYRNPVVYVRWTQAWAYYALALLNRFRSEGKVR